MKKNWKNNSLKGWLYLLPAILFLGLFMVYPLIDVFVYSFEEGYNFASQTYFGTGWYNYSYVLHDPFFLQALKNTFILVVFRSVYILNVMEYMLLIQKQYAHMMVRILFLPKVFLSRMK